VTSTGEQVAYTDAYARSVRARVRHVEMGAATLVVLDRTNFYPGGGGQPSDRGLILRTSDGRGWTVSPINLAELEQIAVYREAVEVAAVRLTSALADRSAIEIIEAMLDSCDTATPREEWHRVGMDFHIELARLSGNEFLFRAVRDAMTRLSRARWLEVRDEAALGRAWSEHHAILAAVRAGDAEAAAARLSAHIVGSRDRLVTSLHNDRRGLRARGFAVVAA